MRTCLSSQLRRSKIPTRLTRRNCRVSRAQPVSGNGGIAPPTTWRAHYVRARHYTKVGGNWTTIDQFWPSESQYGYANNMPISRIDATGFQAGNPQEVFLGGWANWPTDCANTLKKEVVRGLESADRALGNILDELWDIIKFPPFVAIYGNYCGPQVAPPKPVRRKDGTYGPPDGISPTDICCKDHDKCFDNQHCKAWDQHKNPKCQECTRGLCDCFSKIKNFTNAEELGWHYSFKMIYCRPPFTENFKPVLKKTGLRE